MTPIIIFDIETAGLDADWQIKTFEPRHKLDGRIKDPAKVEADRQEKEQEWLDSAALHAERGRVLVIGTTSEGKPEFIEGDEKPMLEAFWRMFDTSTGLFIGHNIKSFDVPFLVRRSYILGVAPSTSVMEGRYLNRRFVDTMELWAAGEWGAKISLDNLARALEVGKKNGNGKDFAALYQTDKSEAMAYLANDLALTAAVAGKMGYV